MATAVRSTSRLKGIVEVALEIVFCSIIVSGELETQSPVKYILFRVIIFEFHEKNELEMIYIYLQYRLWIPVKFWMGSTCQKEKSCSGLMKAFG